MDFMINRGKLPDSANLQFLYIFYNGVNGAILIYPLSLILAMVISVVGMVKKNEMIAFLSLGYSPKKLLLPFATLAFIVTFFFIVLQLNVNSSFAERAKEIKKGLYFHNINRNLFFKFKNNVIFIEKLDVVKKEAQNMKVFVINKDNKVVKIIFMPFAEFKGNRWSSDEAIETTLKKDKIVSKRIKITLLNGFKPYILNKLETKDGISLKLAIESMLLLDKEKIDIKFLKVYIYNAIIPPLTFLLLLIIAFLKAPIHSRISNLPLFIGASTFSAILLWGLFLIFRKLSLSGVATPDILYLTPFITILTITIYYFRKI